MEVKETSEDYLINRIFNATTNDTLAPLTTRLQVFQELSGMPNSPSWYKDYSGTLSIILLLHAIFYFQWYRRIAKKQCLVNYHQLIQRKEYYKGVLAILSHPPSEENAGQRWNSSFHFGFFSDEDQSIQRIRMLLHPFTNGRWSGLPLLLYNSHLLWSCRALEPVFTSSSHYVRSVLAIAILSMALELHVVHTLLERVTGHIGHGSMEYTSIQMESSLPPIARIRHLLQNYTLGTCTALLYAILFVHGTIFQHVSLPVLPLLSIPWYPGLTYHLCRIGLGILSWRHHAVTCLLSGTMAGVLWRSGFYFLGDLYWSVWWLMWVGIASLLSLKVHHWPTMPGVYVSWDVQGIIRVDGVPVITSLFQIEKIHQDQLRLDLDEEENEAGFDSEGDDPDDKNSTVSDLENPLIRGRVPLMSLDSDDEQPLAAQDHRLTRRGGVRLT